MNLQVRLLPPQNPSSESSYVPQSQAVQATFVISVAADETFRSLLEKVRKRNEGRLAKGNHELGQIVGLQNVRKEDLDLSEAVGRVFHVDAGREERVVLAVQTAMSENKGRKRRAEQDGEEQGRGMGKKRKVDRAAVAAKVQSKRNGSVESTPREDNTKFAMQEKSRHTKHSHAHEAGREQILVPDSQDSLPTPRSDSYTSEAPTSAQREIVLRVPASGQSSGLEKMRSSRKLLPGQSMDEDDPIEDKETDNEDRGSEALPRTTVLGKKKTPNKSFQDPHESTTPTARTVTRQRMKAVSKSDRRSSPRTPMNMNANWTTAEDALLLKSLRDKLSVREALQTYNICKTVTAARSRRLLLEREFPNGLSVPLPKPSQDSVGSTSSPSKAQSHASSRTCHVDDTDMLKGAITAGYDAIEIRALYFPGEAQAAVDAKFARALPDVVLSECKKEDWPQDDIKMTGWEGEHNLKLRRCLREKLSVRDAYKRYYSERNFKLIRRKYTAYREQILGEDYDQTEFDDRSLVQSSARKRDTPASKLKAQTPLRKNEAAAGEGMNKRSTIRSIVRDKTQTRDDKAEATVSSPQFPVKALQTRRGPRSTKEKKARAAHQQTRIEGEDGNVEPVVQVNVGEASNQGVLNTKKKAASIGRRKALEVLRRKQVLSADVAGDKGRDAKQKTADTLSTGSADDNVGDTEMDESHGSICPDDVQPRSPEERSTTDMLSMDHEDAFPTAEDSNSTGIDENTSVMPKNDRTSKRHDRSPLRIDDFEQEEAGEVEILASNSDTDSADTSLWQQQASAQLRDSSSVSPEPSAVPKPSFKDPQTSSPQHETPSQVNSAHSALSLHNTVRPFFSLRPDLRPSSQLEQELETSSANSVANKLQDDIIVNAPDPASPESSVDNSVSSHSNMPLEKHDDFEGSPEFMTQVSASSRSQRLKKYGSKSPRTPASVRAPSRALQVEVAKPTIQEAHHTASYNPLPDEEPQTLVESRGSPVKLQPATKGKLRRISSRNTHMSDALKRRSIAEDIQSSSGTALTPGSPQSKAVDAVLPSAEQELATSSRAPEVMTIRPQSTSSASLPAKSFRDIEKIVTRPQSSDDWMDHGLPSMEEHYSAGLSISSRESSPLIDGDLRTVMELAANPEGVRVGVESTKPEIDNIGMAKALQSTRQASVESVEEDIPRNVQDKSDEEGLSDDADSDIAGVDYASSTSEEIEDVIDDREVMEAEDDDDDDVTDDTSSDDDESPGDQSIPAQHVVARFGREKPDASTSDGAPAFDTASDSDEASDADATSSSDSDSEIGTGEISGTKTSKEAQDDDPDMVPPNTPPLSRDHKTIAAEDKHNLNSGSDHALASPAIASRDVSWREASFASEPEVVASSDDSASSDEDSDESESQDSDDESGSDNSEERDETPDFPPRRLSAAGIHAKVIDDVQDEGRSVQEDSPIESGGDPQETDAASKNWSHNLRESEITAPRIHKDRDPALSQTPIVRRVNPNPLSQTSRAQVDLGRPLVLTRASGTATPASTAPVTVGNRNVVKTSLKDSLPKSSPATKAMESPQRQRFRLSNLLGKATSIPASSQNVRKGQPVKRYLPPTDDDDEDSDSDTSSSS